MNPTVCVAAASSGQKYAMPITGLTPVNASTPGSTTVSWTNPDAATYDYVTVYRSIDGGGYTSIGAQAKGAVSVNDTPGVSRDVTYRIISSKAGLADSTVTAGSALRTPPGTPSFVSVSPVNPGVLDFVYNAPLDVEKFVGYDVQLSTATVWGGTVDNTTNLSKSWTGLVHGTVYASRARVRDSLGQTGAWVTTPDQTAANDTTAPTAPAVTHTWSDAIGGGLRGWNVSWAAPTDTQSAIGTVSLEYSIDDGAAVTISGLPTGAYSGTVECVLGNRGHTWKFRTVVTDIYGNSTTGSWNTNKTAKPYGTFFLAANTSNSYHDAGGAAWYGGASTYHGSGDSGNGDGVQTGCWFYGTQIADTCKGYAPDSTTLYVKRKGAAGSTGYNNIQPTSNATQPGGAPTLVGTEDQGPYLSGSDAEANYSLPSSYLTLMGAGTMVGMATTNSGSWRGLYKLSDNAFMGLLTVVFGA